MRWHERAARQPSPLSSSGARKSFFLLARTKQAQLNMNPELKSRAILEGFGRREGVRFSESRGRARQFTYCHLQPDRRPSVFYFKGWERGGGLHRVRVGTGFPEVTRIASSGGVDT